MVCFALCVGSGNDGSEAAVVSTSPGEDVFRFPLRHVALLLLDFPVPPCALEDSRRSPDNPDVLPSSVLPVDLDVEPLGGGGNTVSHSVFRKRGEFRWELVSKPGGVSIASLCMWESRYRSLPVFSRRCHQLKSCISPDEDERMSAHKVDVEREMLNTGTEYRTLNDGLC